MSTVKENIKTDAIELTEVAFQTFCEDITAMFQVNMTCERKETVEKPIRKLNRKFKNLCAVNTISTKGAMNGNFYLIFDQNALFVLSGIITMLPEKRVIENCQTGSEKSAQESEDAIGELGNLMVGSWDRTFREELEGHEHFKQTNTFVGKPFKETEETLKIDSDEEVTADIYQVKVGSYPVLNCAAVFPKNIFEESNTEAPSEQEGKEETAEKQDTENQESEPENQDGDKTEAKSDAEKDEDKPEETKPEQESAEQTAETEANSQATEQTDNKETDQTPVNQPAGLKGASDIPVKQIMRQETASLKPEQTIEEAVELMQQKNTPYLLVKSEASEHIEGIISRSDITSGMSPYLNPTFKNFKRPLDQATLKIRVKWIMTCPVETINIDQPISAAIRKMLTCGIRCLPVIDNENKTCGIINVFDILNAVNPESSDIKSVKVCPPVMSLN